MKTGSVYLLLFACSFIAHVQHSQEHPPPPPTATELAIAAKTNNNTTEQIIETALAGNETELWTNGTSLNRVKRSCGCCGCGCCGCCCCKPCCCCCCKPCCCCCCKPCCCCCCKPCCCCCCKPCCCCCCKPCCCCCCKPCCCCGCGCCGCGGRKRRSIQDLHHKLMDKQAAEKRLSSQEMTDIVTAPIVSAAIADFDASTTHEFFGQRPDFLGQSYKNDAPLIPDTPTVPDENNNNNMSGDHTATTEAAKKESKSQ